MKFYTQTHKHYCGIDLHARCLYVCILDQDGTVLVHQNIKANPQAYVYPREMRGTRDLMRRRMHLMRKRSELLAHIHNTNSQYNLPEIKKNLRYAFNREGITERFSDASVQKSIELDLNLIGFYDQQLSKVEWFIQQQARTCDQHSLILLRTVPGIGKILSLVILYEIHSIERFPTVQNFASYCRLIKCKKESAGKSYGTSGKKIGNAYLKWAFSEAAVLFLRKNPDAQAWVERMANKHNKARALTILAHKLGRAVYFMLKRKTVFDQERFLNR